MKKSKKFTFIILISLFVQIFSGINLGNIVKAEDNKNFNFIKAIKLTDFQGNVLEEGIDKSSDVRVNFDFEIPNVEDVKEGEIFKVTIPKQIQLISDFEKELYDEDGQVVAIAYFKKTGVIDIEFTKYTGEYSNVRGNFYLDTKFDRNNIGNKEIENIEFNLLGESEPFIIEIKFKQDPIIEPSISKKSIGYNGVRNEITWEIEFNKENTNVENAKIIDNIPIGQEYIEGSATIDNGADNNLFIYTKAEISDAEKSGVLAYTFPAVVNKKHVISFKTRISDPSILPKEQGGTIKLTNKAILKFNDKNKESNEATVDVKTNYIEKAGTYNANEKKINWTIKVNNNALTLSNLKIQDIIPEGLEIIDDSFKINNEVNSNYEYDKITNILEYTFNGTINTQQIISFSTKVIDEKVYQSNDSTNFKNTATIVQGLISTPSSTATVGVGSNILNKTAQGYNTSNHYISWKIEVNSNQIELLNPVITDNIPLGQKYVQGSFKIDGEVPDSNKFNYVIAVDNDATKTGTITYNFNESINKKHIITFNTEVTDSNVYAGNIVQAINYFNTATMIAGNISKEVTSTAKQGVRGNVINKQALPYDYLNKEITWKITVNNNKTKLRDVVITDNIPVNQEYIEGSAQINNNGDNSNFSYVKADGNDTEKSGTLTYTFKKDINETYDIIFKTKIKDESIFYENENLILKNKAYITSSDMSQSVSIEAPVEIKSSVINKTAEYTNGNSFIDWNVNINSNSINMGKVEVEDILQDGLELDTTSIELYKQILNSNGSLVKGEKVELNSTNVKYDINTRKFTFSFSDEVNIPYLLTFRTDVVDKSKQPFSNTIQFKGEKTNKTSDVKDIKVEFQSGGGSAIGTRGSITLVKLDKDNNNKKLKGARFTLIDKYKNIITTAETNENGEVKFDKLKFDIPYTVKEVSAPVGYVLDENNSYEFTIKSADDSKNIIKTFYNESIKGTVELKKVNESNDILEGTEFTVYNKESESEVDKGVTNSDGIVKFEDLVYGEYYYIETKASKGYLLDSTRHYFDIKDNAVVLKETVKNEKIVGNIEVIKVDEENKFLENSEISLYDLDGNIVQKAITNKEGTVIFENIPYGDYEVKETKAPEGYNLSTEVLKVSIDKEKSGLIYEAGTITNTKIKSDIKINKLDQDKNSVIGAEFTLYNNLDEVISTAETNEDGIAIFEDIFYGNYYVKETKTPEGYIGRDEEYKVNIIKNNIDQSIEITNTRIKGSIEITKNDESGKLLEGAEFAIYDKSSEIEVAKGTTDESGVVKFEELVYGNYYYVETKAPEGYLLNSERYEFEIKDNGLVLKESAKNEKILGNISVVKTDEVNNFLSNAEITLYDLQGNLVQKELSDETGKVIFKNVPYGKYKIQETKAPEGYILSNKVLEISIDKAETGLFYEAGTIINTKIKADIKINKLDQDGNRVIGAEFTLYNNLDEVISTAETNEDGIALFKDIFYGDYYVKETKTPEGYVGTDEKLQVSIKENNSVYSYEIENERIKGTIEIVKIDENGNLLSGAEFTLYSKQGEEISRAISDENGLIRFVSVDYGIYILKETKAPEGYINDNIEIEVVIDSSNKKEFTVKNIKIEENNMSHGNTNNQEKIDNLVKRELPLTGDVFDIKLLLILGVVLVLIGSIFVRNKKVEINNR